MAVVISECWNIINMILAYVLETLGFDVLFTMAVPFTYITLQDSQFWQGH